MHVVARQWPVTICRRGRQTVRGVHDATPFRKVYRRLTRTGILDTPFYERNTLGLNGGRSLSALP